MTLPLPTQKEGEYSAYNSGSVEQEVGEFLYGMVRIVKPKLIYETGTHKGISAAYMGMGLKENGKGLLYTVEFDSHHWEDAKRLWKDIGVENQIIQDERNMDVVMQQAQQATVDMLFLDSEPDRRFKELIYFYPSLREGGFVFIHDLHNHLGQQKQANQVDNWPFGTLPMEIRNWMKEGELRPWYFANPRGMTGFQKRRHSEKPDWE